MPIFNNFLVVALPTIYKSLTGRGHIFFCISSLKRVCTLFGFLKSDAILASNLLLDTPILTVKPSSCLILSLKWFAAAFGEDQLCWLGVKSKKHSSTENL